MTQHAEARPRAVVPRSPMTVVPFLGIVQILMWGSTLYLLAVLAPAIVADTGWPFSWVTAGVTIGLMVAGLISPKVGGVIEARGGRPVLVFASAATAGAFLLLAVSHALPVYFAAWLLMGVGMGTGLYDSVFAALGRLYGKEARSAVTNLTLFGGFGSTVCWPLSAYLVATWDWRTACLVYAALHLFVALPIHALAFPREERRSAGSASAGQAAAATLSLSREQRMMFWLLAAMQTFAQAIGAIVIVHLLVFMQARGLTLAEAVTLGTLFGPAQVGARVIERIFGHSYHPIWTMIAASALMTLGLAMLLIDLPIVAAAVIVYGAGYGVTWIARGTLPLALFGPENYPVLIGRLALPSLFAQALAPLLGALIIEGFGAHATVSVLLALALVNVAVVLALWRLSPAPSLPAGEGGPAR